MYRYPRISPKQLQHGLAPATSTKAACPFVLPNSPTGCGQVRNPFRLTSKEPRRGVPLLVRRTQIRERRPRRRPLRALHRVAAANRVAPGAAYAHEETGVPIGSGRGLTTALSGYNTSQMPQRRYFVTRTDSQEVPSAGLLGTAAKLTAKT